MPDRRILAVGGVVALVVAVAFAAVMIPLIHNAPERPPEITAYAHGRTIAIAPYSYCDMKLSNCSRNPRARLDVPVGYPLQLSLPKTISDAPWWLTAYYLEPNGNILRQTKSYPRGTTSTVSVRSEKSPPLPLALVEIHTPSAMLDAEENPLARGVWAVQTN